MGGMFGFLRSFGIEKLGKVGETITQKIVSWDPETASQAEIEEMIRELDKITTEAGKARATYDRERAEAEAAKKNYDKFLAAAELLNKRLEESQSAGDQAKSQELSNSLNKLHEDLEGMKPEVEREVQEADEANAYYEELKELAEVTADKVKKAKDMLEKGRRDMQRAELERQRAQARADKAQKVAGLKNETSSLGVALAAMNRQAEVAKAAAAGSDMKAQLLTTERKGQDDNIKAALAEVAGEPETKTLSLSDRLASLKKK
jgi:chromosome segregation ATPase